MNSSLKVITQNTRLAEEIKDYLDTVLPVKEVLATLVKLASSATKIRYSQDKLKANLILLAMRDIHVLKPGDEEELVTNGQIAALFREGGIGQQELGEVLIRSQLDPGEDEELEDAPVEADRAEETSAMEILRAAGEDGAVSCKLKKGKVVVRGKSKWKDGSGRKGNSRLRSREEEGV